MTAPINEFGNSFLERTSVNEFWNTSWQKHPLMNLATPLGKNIS